MYSCSRRRLVSILFIIIFSFVFLQTNLIRDIGYITRPLWDKPAIIWDPIPHYFTPTFTDSEYCTAQNWTLRPKPLPRVFDAVIFSVELDILDIRLHELWDIVDYFVILESDRTFTGHLKPLVFQENIERFSWAANKTLYFAFKGLRELAPREDPFINEDTMRKAMNDFLYQKSGIRTGDILLVSDLDEIPSENAVRLVKVCHGWPNPMHFMLRQYVYSFEFYLDMEGWGSTAIVFKEGETEYAHLMRTTKILTDAGWHCSSCFRHISDFQFKMQSYSHADRVTHESLLSPEMIQKRICEGSDLFDVSGSFHLP